MYTNEDLNKAVDEGIFTDESVERFRDHIDQQRHSVTADEENFRLVSSFNDIFVVIASVLVFVSAAWITGNGVGGSMLVAALAWGLAEVFVRRRRMVLPANVLLVVFLGGLFALGMVISRESVFVSGLLASVGAVVHWRRFRVPITVAAGAATVSAMVIGILTYLFPALERHWEMPIFVAGVAVFGLAMWWDGQDKRRTTRRSDVAFWLHLLAAPMIVHSIFTVLGVFEGDLSGGVIALIIVLYGVLSLISLVIDRRAFMVSSLVYVLYALSELFSSRGFTGSGMAVAGLLIGGALLLLTIYWGKVRCWLLGYVSPSIRQMVPEGNCE
jgi:hypothetical protein